MFHRLEPYYFSLLYTDQKIDTSLKSYFLTQLCLVFLSMCDVKVSLTFISLSLVLF